MHFIWHHLFVVVLSLGCSFVALCLWAAVATQRSHREEELKAIHYTLTTGRRLAEEWKQMNGYHA